MIGAKTDENSSLSTAETTPKLDAFRVDMARLSRDGRANTCSSNRSRDYHIGEDLGVIGCHHLCKSTSQMADGTRGGHVMQLNCHVISNMN